MLGLFFLHLAGVIFDSVKIVVKLAIVLAVFLAPYALDAAMDKWLGNSLPPTYETEKSHE